MAFIWDSLYSVFERTRNYLVDPPGEKNPAVSYTHLTLPTILRV